MPPFEALYGRECGSPIGWFEVGAVKTLGADLVKDGQDKVRSIQTKFYLFKVDNRSMIFIRKGTWSFRQAKNVLLKVSPMKGEMRFVKKGKFSPQYISLFDVPKYVGPGNV